MNLHITRITLYLQSPGNNIIKKLNSVVIYLIKTLEEIRNDAKLRERGESDSIP